MTKLILPIITGIMVLILSNCDDSLLSGNRGSTGDTVQKTGEWLIPQGQVYDGGPGKDGIPAVSDPKFLPVSDVSYLDNNDLVVGVKFGDQIRAYPHLILDWHEIVNDRVQQHALSVTYCPLTGSAVGWHRTLENKETTFGVSGLLYNSNLIPYDRQTDSYWTQMGLRCVAGDLKGTNVEMFRIVETTWETWKDMYPNSVVQSTDTGYDRRYGVYPYDDYKTNHNSLYFPVSHRDSRLKEKVRILGLLSEGNSMAFPIRDFPDTTQVLNIEFDGQPYVIAGNRDKNFVVAFSGKMHDSTLVFTSIDDALPVIMIDEGGTRWDIFGRAVSGAGAGEELQLATSYIAYWFAWAAFYPEVEIYQRR